MTFRFLLVEKLPVWVRFFVTFWASTRMHSLRALHLANLNLQMLMPPPFRFRMLLVLSFLLFLGPRSYLEDL